MKSLAERFESIGWSIWRGWRYHWGPRALRRRVVKFYQRGIRGWSDEDTWSFDYYLSRVIVGGVASIRKYAHGYPAILDPDGVLDTIGGQCISGGESHDRGMERWQAVLTQIIRGFAAQQLLSDAVCWTIEGEELYHDLELEAKLMAEQKAGFELFAQYFGGLWD